MPLIVLLLLFTGLPLLEFSLLVQIHDRIGMLATVGLVLATGAVGAALAKHQGVQTLLRLRTSLGRGEAPADALLDGALILIAGAVLVTPGVVTDAIGFLLLIPPARAVVKRSMRAWFARRVRVVTTQKTTFSGYGRGPFPPPTGGDVIDVEAGEVRGAGGASDTDRSPND